jgi:SRSO17 transposase
VQQQVLRLTTPKPDIALGQIRSLVNEDVPRGVVLADAAYGDDSGFREGLVSLGLYYAVGIKSATTLWPSGIMPLQPRPKGKTGRPPRLLRRDEQHQPLSAKDLALCLSATDLRKVNWREGTRGMMRSRFAAIPVRVAHRDYWRKEPHPEQWLLIEWPAGEKEPTKYLLSNLNASIILRKLVAITKLRWRIERDYEELKQELGLGHSRVETGADFIIMQPCRLQPMASWFWSGAFPPLSQFAARQSRKHPASNIPNAVQLHAPRRCP